MTRVDFVILLHSARRTYDADAEYVKYSHKSWLQHKLRKSKNSVGHGFLAKARLAPVSSREIPRWFTNLNHIHISKVPKQSSPHSHLDASWASALTVEKSRDSVVNYGSFESRRTCEVRVRMWRSFPEFRNSMKMKALLGRSPKQQEGNRTDCAFRQCFKRIPVRL